MKYSIAPPILVLTALLTLLGVGCSDRGAKAPAGVPEVAVRAGEVLRQTVPVTVEVVGSVEAFNSVLVLPRVTGQILKSHFKEGQSVVAGDLLFTIDPAPFDQKLKEYGSQLAMDRSKLSYSKAQAERYAYLLKEGMVSRADGDRIQAEAVQFAQAVESDKAAMEQARLNLSYCEVRSPVSGQAGNYLADQGAVVEALKTRLVQVNQVQPVKVVFSVAERYLPDIKRLMADGAEAVSVSIPETALKRDGGKISFLDNTVDQASGMVRLKAEFPNQDTVLWPGQYVRVSMLIAKLPDAVVAPTEAVQANQKGSYVFVVKTDSTVELRSVTAGQAHGRFTVVSQGLAPGETVVTDGQNKLQSGRKVKVLGPEPAGVSPPAGARRS